MEKSTSPNVKTLSSPNAVDKDRIFEKMLRRKRALDAWDWENVIDVDNLTNVQPNAVGLQDNASNHDQDYDVDSEKSLNDYMNVTGWNDESDEEGHDTADSFESIMKKTQIPRVFVFSRNKVIRRVKYS
ncbi:hypothetical protein E3N88_03240 [Mikania micrantha]|uniref:Uncharacterized protein n=1 Tax=Mikania micrantha TaxID=192012 RepID=A0A5N6Q5X4_9ASTR|nr:hypothetical protein E3N88_03240 [Mikania micrantha]